MIIILPNVRGLVDLFYLRNLETKELISILIMSSISLTYYYYHYYFVCVVCFFIRAHSVIGSRAVEVARK
jgi:hypothetical protein